MKAIAVDDSRATRMILKSSLLKQGFEEVLEAADGKLALEVLAANGPVDLALVDWNMPIMTGYELICAVRGKRELDSMAIMMITTEAEASQVQRAMDAGANEYLTKPFTPEQLYDKLLLLGFAS